MKPRVEMEPDLEYCDDCRSCELACSFHHLARYQPSRASIEISRNYATGIVSRTLYHVAEGGHIPCDDCAGEKQKRCLEFCSMQKIAQAFANKKSE